MAALISSGSDDPRIVLLGNAGVGKSATANIILGRETFRETETTECEIQRGRVNGWSISVIDTPGINSSEQLRTETKRCLLLSAPGPHVFLLVIRVRNFTEDVRDTVKWIQENFGEEALNFTMVLLTGKEDLTKSQWTKFSQDTKTLEFVEKCGLGYFGINSKREVNPTQITKLLEKIKTRVQQNGGQYYSNETFEAFQRKIREGLEEERRKKDKERRRQEEEENKRSQTKEKVHRKDTDLILCTDTGDGRRPSGSNPQDETRRRTIINLIPEQNPQSRTEDGQTTTRIQEIKKAQEQSAMVDLMSIKEDLRRRQEKQKVEEQLEKWKKKRATGGMTPKPESLLRIMLLGVSKSGKSETGNTILGQAAFGRNIHSTSQCRKQEGRLGNKVITVIDTRGVSQGADNSTYQTLFEESLSLSGPGPHVFLLVVQSPDILNNTVYPLMNSLGSEFFKRALILLTHGDIWGSDHRRVLETSSELKRLVNRCGGDFQIFNNANREDRTQVTGLLEKIEVLLQKNGGQHYTNEMYLAAQRKMMEDRVCVLEEKVDALRRQSQNESEDHRCCLL